MDARGSRAFAQRQEGIACEFAAYGGGDHRPMRRAKKTAERPARDLILGEGFAFELGDCVEIVDNRLANDKAALAPIVHVGLSGSGLALAVTPARIGMSIVAFLANSV